MTTTDTRVHAGAAAYRGFLFSDVRGFTAFAERHGNIAAAAMVARFLDVARTAIARHQGAEIKTEGDAIHAVFPSASSAVLCGLDIQDAAAEVNAEQPERPLGLGVGVHAGEAVETAEGYIGRAVNIAARLCAAARPGEVLVSSTVKGITQSSITVGFIPRGRRRLKGIDDLIVVYAVSRDVTAKAPRSVPRPVLIGAGGMGVVAVLAIAALAGSQLLAPTPSAPLVTTPPPQRVQIGPLPIGTYGSIAFKPEVTFDIVDLNWNATADSPDTLGLVHVAAPQGNVEFLRVSNVLESPCGQGPPEGAQTGPSAADLLTKLRGLTDYLTVSDPKTVRVGGFTGSQVDVSVADGALAACGGLAGAGVSIFNVGGQTWSAASGERFTLFSLDVRGEPVTIVVSTDWTQTPSIEQLQSLLVIGMKIVNSARF